MKINYKDYFIDIACPDIQGYLGYSHAFAADGYDGAIDSEDYRRGFGSSVEDCIDQINEQINEQELEYLGVTA